MASNSPEYTSRPWRMKPVNGRFRVYGPPHPVDGGDYAPLAEFSEEGDAVLAAAAPEMREALMEAHNAIDELFARLVLADATFKPSKSGRPWDALLQVNAAIAKSEAH